MSEIVPNQVLKVGDGLSYRFAVDSPVQKTLINTLEVISGRKKLQKRYREIEAQNLQGFALWKELIRQLELTIDIDKKQIAKIPEKGSLLVVANHPFGVIDGLLLGYIMSQRRKDFMIVVHEALTKEPMFQKYLLPIDFRETKQALATNIKTRNMCIERLSNQGSIAIFPSGSVATTKKITDRTAYDLEWKRFTAKLVTKTQPTVVPIYFHGQNSSVFQIASHINQNIRYGLLLREVVNKMGNSIKVDVQDPVPFNDIPKGMSRQELLDYLRSLTINH